MPVRVLIADSSFRFRARLRDLLGARPSVEIVGEASNGDETLELCRRLLPDVLVLDVVLPPADGILLLEEIRSAKLLVRSIVLTQDKSVHWVRNAFNAGAAGYIFKDSDLTDLATMLQGVITGDIRFCKEALRLLATDPRTDPPKTPHTPLTKREKQVLELIAEGKSSKEIARILERSVRTVDAHRSSIMKKLGARSLAELVRYELQ